MGAVPLADVTAALRARAEELERWGAGDTARALRTAAEEVQAAWEAYWNTPLTLDQAAGWSGYSLSQLRKHAKAGTIPPCPDGRLLRRHLPIRPGHAVPLGIASTVPDLVERSYLRAS